MADTNDGGPAFPASDLYAADTGDRAANASQGMSLRDYFAAKAMQAYVSTYPNGTAGAEADRVDNIAADAYALADAMLKARQS